MRGKYAAWILEKKHPGLLTLHLIALDHIEHETGAFSAESIATLERLDAVIGKVWEAAERKLGRGAPLWRWCLTMDLQTTTSN